MFSRAVLGDGTPEPEWTLDRIVARAREQSSESKALDKDIERAEALAGQAGKWDNPEASLSYGPMNQAGATASALEASLRQSIPLFGQRAIAKRVGEETKKSTEIEAGGRRLRLEHEVVRLAYRLAAIAEQAQHVAHRREKIGLIGKYLESRPFASPSQSVEKSLLLNRFREIEEKFLEVTAAKEGTWRALNVFVAMEHPISPSVEWSDAPSPPSHDQLWQLALDQNPDLRRQRSLIAVASLQADQAGKKAFPDVRLGGAYSLQTIDPTQRIYSGTLDFSLPLWDRGGYAQAAALALREAESLRLEQRRKELEARFEQAWSELARNRKRIALFPTALVAGLEAQMQRAEQNWKKGLVPVTAFLELENQVHEQAVKVYDAQTDYIESLSELQLLAGRGFEKGAR